MPKLDSLIRQDPPHEQPAVTVARFTLTANQGKSVLACAVKDSSDRRTEARVLRHRPVEGMPISVVVLVARGTPAKFRTQVEVPNPPSADRLLEVVSIELWSEARVGKRPDIDQELDPLTGDEPREPVEVVVRMSDCPDGKPSDHDRHRTTRRRRDRGGADRAQVIDLEV